MRLSSLVTPAAAVCLLSAAVFAAPAMAPSAQEPQTAPQAAPPAIGAPRPQRNYPAPTNLKVLPKDLTGAQVRDVMHHWAGDLGQECNACHAAYPNKVDERGHPMLDFASDDKPEKQMARIMYTMIEDMKKNYVEKVKALDTMGSPVPPLTCGTCHRGHLDPEEYVPPRREHRGPVGRALSPP